MDPCSDRDLESCFSWFFSAILLMNSILDLSSAEPCDQSLVRMVRDGNDDAATELYERYARRVLGLVQSQSGPHLLAQVEPEDIVQSIFKSVFRGVAAGAYDAPPSGTLWQLIAVIAVHKIRRNASKRVAAKRDNRRTESLQSIELDPANHQNDAAAVEVAIKEAIECLKPSEQEAVLLRVQGYGIEEIADRLGRSRRTIERQLQRAREILADQLLDHPHLPSN
jgi:RNA polymerase sigma-70 factor, ECF subfamily